MFTGLVQDLGHLCRAAGCGAEVEAGALPLSPAGRALIEADPGRLALALGGGDDYELVFAALPEATSEVMARASALGIPVTRIGRFVEAPAEVTVRGPGGAPLALPRQGWSHF